MDFIWSLQIALTGILVVFVTLIFIQGLLEIPQFLKRFGGKNKDDLERESLDPEEIPAETLVVIAAAVAMMDKPYRIKTIEVSGNENWERYRYTENTTL